MMKSWTILIFLLSFKAFATTETTTLSVLGCQANYLVLNSKNIQLLWDNYLNYFHKAQLTNSSINDKACSIVYATKIVDQVFKLIPGEDSSNLEKLAAYESALRELGKHKQSPHSLEAIVTLAKSLQNRWIDRFYPLIVRKQDDEVHKIMLITGSLGVGGLGGAMILFRSYGKEILKAAHKLFSRTGRRAILRPGSFSHRAIQVGSRANLSQGTLTHRAVRLGGNATAKAGTGTTATATYTESKDKAKLPNHKALPLSPLELMGFADSEKMIEESSLISLEDKETVLAELENFQAKEIWNDLEPILYGSLISGALAIAADLGITALTYLSQVDEILKTSRIATIGLKGIRSSLALALGGWLAIELIEVYKNDKIASILEELEGKIAKNQKAIIENSKKRKYFVAYTQSEELAKNLVEYSALKLASYNQAQDIFYQKIERRLICGTLDLHQDKSFMNVFFKEEFEKLVLLNTQITKAARKDLQEVSEKLGDSFDIVSDNLVANTDLNPMPLGQIGSLANHHMYMLNENSRVTNNWKLQLYKEFVKVKYILEYLSDLSHDQLLIASKIRAIAAGKKANVYRKIRDGEQEEIQKHINFQDYLLEMRQEYNCRGNIPGEKLFL